MDQSMPLLTQQMRRGETTPVRTSTIGRRMVGSPSVSSLSSRSTIRDLSHGLGVDDGDSSYSRNGNSVPGSVSTDASYYSIDDTTEEDNVEEEEEEEAE